MAVVDDAVISISCSGPSAGLFVPAKTGVNIAPITAGNIASQEAKLAAYATAVNDVTLGIVNSTSIIIGAAVATGGPSATAPRGTKWIVSAQESSGDLNKFTYTIPAANEATGVAGTTNYDPANAAWIAFKSAFEAIAVSPAAIALVFVSAKIGGRRR
jgi:hypothetical protein